MRVACCCDGSGTAILARRALADLKSVDTLDFVYCIDAAVHGDVLLAQGSILGRMHRGESHAALVSAAEEQRALAVLEEAATAARTAGFLGDLQTVALHGRPEREIVRALAERQTQVVVLFARPPERQRPPGPHSIGHVARFIIDHAPCQVLLVRNPLL